MRGVKNPQSSFGQVNIADIHISARSRDDIPAVLKGLQHIYMQPDTREKVFTLLEKSFSSNENK